MEVIKHYPEIDELVSSITRIANHLDQLTEIMTTTSVKVTPEKEKQIRNTLYGMSVARPLPDWDPEILRSEIQDLKLENDRLEKQKEIMLHFIKSVRCKGLVCESCDLHFLNDQGTDLCAQVDHVKLESIATDILNKVDKL